MKKIQRQTIAAAGLIAAAVVSAPMTATAQRSAGPRTPIFIAVTFRSPTEPKLGIDVAEGLRQRMIKLFPQGPRAQLRVITREQINAQLTAAGYPADSAITTTDLRDLGKNVGADETLEGTATRTAEGVRVTARFYSLNNVAAAEVLPTVVDKDPANAGRLMADLYAKARRELPDYEQCRGGLINHEVDRAIIAAKAATAAVRQGRAAPRLPDVGVLQQFKDKKMPIDSVLRVGAGDHDDRSRQRAGDRKPRRRLSGQGRHGEGDRDERQALSPQSDERRARRRRSFRSSPAPARRTRRCRSSRIC